MYLISTKEFGISEQYFHIFRGVHGARKIPFEQITFIRINYDSLVNRPIIVTLFALSFLVVPALSINYLTSINGFEFISFFQNGKTGGTLLVLIMLSIMMAIWVIYQVLKSRIILTIHHCDKSIHKLKLKEIIDRQQLTELLKILTIYFKPHQLKLYKKIQQNMSNSNSHI